MLPVREKTVREREREREKREREREREREEDVCVSKCQGGYAGNLAGGAV